MSKGPPPATNRRRRNVPARGDWTPTPGIGWQHGKIPEPPPDLLPDAIFTWQAWFRAWFASHWRPDDLPNLRLIIKLYSHVWTGGAMAAERAELRQLMDTYGITPKGQQDRRWAPPESEQSAAKPTAAKSGEGPYGHLRVVNE